MIFFSSVQLIHRAANDLTHFLYLYKTIGVPIKMSKTQTPTTSIIIYGIEIDSCKMEARLPVESQFLPSATTRTLYLRKKEYVFGKHMVLVQVSKLFIYVQLCLKQDFFYIDFLDTCTWNI